MAEPPPSTVPSRTDDTKLRLKEAALRSTGAIQGWVPVGWCRIER
jgi:hypothetical protein